MTTRSRVCVDLVTIVAALLHALELGVRRPMPDWVAYFGVFGPVANLGMALTLLAGALIIPYGLVRESPIERTGLLLVAAAFAMNATGRIMWVVLDMVGAAVPQPPSVLSVSAVTLSMYAALYAVAAAALIHATRSSRA